MAQQFTERAEVATHPFQYALSTRAGTECIAHVIQALTDMNENTTILSIDGVGAYDNISRNAMFRGVADMVDGDKLIPFIRQFYSTPSKFFWEDEVGDVHHIHQGEGGEQRDPLMLLLFSLGQHRALVAVQAQLKDDERLFAFLDDFYVTSPIPDRVGDAYLSLEEHLFTRAGISVHQGKTKIWNRSGVKPLIADLLTAAAKSLNPQAVVWRGDHEFPLGKQGLKVLGVPVGSSEYVLAQLVQKVEDRIPQVQDVQAAWLLLLFCASPRANYWLRTLQPEFTEDFGRRHDENVFKCLCRILHIGSLPGDVRAATSLPLTLGGLGVGAAMRIRDAAHWGSWAGWCKNDILKLTSSVELLLGHQDVYCP